MGTIPKSRQLAVLVVFTLATGLSTTLCAEALQGVSPGAADRLTTIRGGCPTFSWEAANDAGFYEIVVYSVGDRFDNSILNGTGLTEADEVLYARVPGGATSWTPSLEERLPRGGSFIWFVRAADLEDADMVVSSSQWSRGMLFAIADTPSTEEVHMAFEVMQNYLRSENVQIAARDLPSESSQPDHSRRTPVTKGATGGMKSMPTAPAAIRGENADNTGESYGVVGTTASPDGAGLGALNLAGGPDLVLDGSIDTATDTQLRESGIYRESVTVESFTIANSTFGPGGISLQVDGPAEVQGKLTAGSADLGTTTIDADLIVQGGTTMDGNTALGETAADTVTFNAVAASSLDMNDHLLVNIGVPGTDFTASGGLNLSGDLDVTGGITNFQLTSEYTVTHYNSTGSSETPMVPISDSFCFLVLTSVTGIGDDNESGYCYVNQSGGLWVLQAGVDTASLGGMWCMARCFQW